MNLPWEVANRYKSSMKIRNASIKEAKEAHSNQAKINEVSD
jgi:hypothetical protein